MKKGFMLLPVLLIITILGVTVYLVAKSLNIYPQNNMSLSKPSYDQNNDMNECDVSLNASENREVVELDQKCKFVKFDDLKKTKFSFTYPKGWKSGIVSAAGTNISLISNNGNTVYIFQSSSNLLLMDLDKEKLCYEGCDLIVGSNEKVIAKTVETYGTKKVLKLVTNMEDKKMERLFFLSNEKEDNKNLLLIFEFEPSDIQYENSVIEIIKSLEIF
jgi:hypothetical protein